jgi:putative MFS transporter
MNRVNGNKMEELTEESKD